MKFYFSAKPESPSMEGVFHLLVREAGGKPKFDAGKVVTMYEGGVEDEVFKKLIELYEAQPECVITISTK